MTFRVIYRMASTFKRHPAMICTTWTGLQPAERFLPPKGRGFHLRFSQFQVIEEGLPAIRRRESR